MKPHVDSLCVVTCTTNPDRAAECIKSWLGQSHYDWRLIVELNGFGLEPYLGVVPAFAKALQKALQTKAEVIALLHDDLFIHEAGWDATVLAHFEQQPSCGLAGFGGGKTLGHPEIYQIDYEPHQLARGSFISNMEEAEQHGDRVQVPRRVACLDGFSQIGRRGFWTGFDAARHAQIRPDRDTPCPNLFRRMADLGIVHHAYDAALGCYAKRLGWDAWVLPISCHHLGGVTAVADRGYHAWADATTGSHDGDHEFWLHAHRVVYDEFKDVLPFGALP